ncbi:Solanesyl diphosphate synthase [Thalictrum thalictroides]|uniref:Solanesyl diphosphate synthase n=1 Tax=Thalictrum thalictroides TaxID=46969 RepID=A0A7J6W998_THATH|nr:Solanesyl diphosphate synthase [Thalictrum thalictroides]
MMSLTCRNFDLCRTRLDLFACGCSSNENYSRLLFKSGSRRCGARKLVCNPSSQVAPCRAFAPVKTPVAVLNDYVPVVVKNPELALDTNPNSSSSISITSLLEVVADDLLTLNKNLQSIVGAENPVLISAAEQIFSAGGKRMRPALVFLVARATAEIKHLRDLTPEHRRLAEIIEMIHTASLIHDDVLDDSSIRRGKETIHQIYGTRVAILAGDFMFAQSSWYLANLENLEVIKLISQVIKDFASGEIKQASSLFDCDVTLEEYLMKSYYKTASLIASSTKGAAIFSGVDRTVCEQMYDFGRNLGLSFQIVDDILDFTQSEEQLGKPAGIDLTKGNLTAPVIFALEKEPKLREIIDTEFSEAGSFDEAVNLIFKSGGITRAQNLAREKADLAMQNLKCLPQNEFRSSLEGMVRYNLERID